MRWRRKPAPPPPDPGIDEAAAALEAALAQWPDVRETSERLRTIRRENHLAESAYQVMREHRR